MKGKRWMGWAILACAVCCALPFVILGVGGLVAIGADAWICGVLLLIGAVAWFTLSRRGKIASCCAATGESSCSTGCGCKPD